MATKKSIEEKRNNLNYVAYYIIQAFEETGMDEAYIFGKIEELSKHKNKYESLEWACRCLDPKHLPIFATKMDFTFDEIQATKHILKKV